MGFLGKREKMNNKRNLNCGGINDKRGKGKCAKNKRENLKLLKLEPFVRRQVVGIKLGFCLYLLIKKYQQANFPISLSLCVIEPWQ